MRKMCT